MSIDFSKKNRHKKSKHKKEEREKCFISLSKFVCDIMHEMLVSPKDMKHSNRKLTHGESFLHHMCHGDPIYLQVAYPCLILIPKSLQALFEIPPLETSSGRRSSPFCCGELVLSDLLEVLKVA